MILKRLVQYRILAGWRQEDLAKKLGKDQAYVSKVENGERKLPIEEFVSLCRALEMEPHDVLRSALEE